jgi:G3E family GTPase
MPIIARGHIATGQRPTAAIHSAFGMDTTANTKAAKAPEAQGTPSEHRKVPALVVSGFLGSGKTTLVRELLRDAQSRGVRVAVVSNELGELGIDRALLGGGGEAFVEIEGGCVCCELSNDLVDTLQMLREQVDPDRVIVETSGVALPFDTQLNFWRDPVREWIGDDMAVVVVNAEQLAEGRDLEGTFGDQVGSADLLVLNKVDLVAADALDGLEDRLREIEPEAPIVRSLRGDVDPAVFFPPDGGEIDRQRDPPVTPPHQHDEYFAREHRFEPGVSEEFVEAELLGPGMLRAKGFVATDAGTRLVQIVGRRIEWSTPDVIPEASLIGRVVRIQRTRRT